MLSILLRLDSQETRGSLFGVTKTTLRDNQDKDILIQKPEILESPTVKCTHTFNLLFKHNKVRDNSTLVIIQVRFSSSCDGERVE